MPTLLSLMGDYSLVFLVLLAAAAVAAIIYVPAPAKQYVVSALLMAAVASQVFGMGYQSATAVWELKYTAAQAKYEQDLAQISAADQKSASDAMQRELDHEQANEAKLKADLEAQAAAAEASEKQYQSVLDEINKAAGDADQSAPGLILDAIGRQK